MIKAGSLYYALILTLLIGILLGVLMFTFSMQTIFNDRLEAGNELIDYNESSVNYALANFKNFDSVRVTLFESNYKSFIKKEKWGVLDLVNCKSYGAKDTIHSIFSVGTQLKNKLAVYLSNANNPLHLFNTTITGDCMLPKLGYDELQLSRKSSRRIHINGKISASEKKLPILKEIFSLNYSNLKNLNFSELNTNLQLYNPFTNAAVIILMDDKKNLNNVIVSGKYIIKSYDSIYISKSAILDNVIIKSPVIYIENGFKGSVQLSATKRIVLEDNVSLSNNSSLYINSIAKNAIIKIEKNCFIQGIIILEGKAEDVMTNKILIHNNTIINGTIYCNGLVDLKGSVFGSVYTNYFYANTGTSEYLNALIDAVIVNNRELEDTPQINIFKTEKANYKLLNKLW